MSEDYIKENKNLKKELAFYKNIIDSLDIDIFWKDEKGKILGINQTALNSLNLKKEDVVGKTEQDFVATELFQEIQNHDLLAGQADKSVNFQETYLDKGIKQGTYLTKRNQIKNNQDNVKYMLVAGIDIAAHKRLEKILISDKKEITNKYSQIQLNLQQILDTLDANIYWKDINSKFLGMNNKNLSLLSSLSGKHLSKKDVVGKTDTQMFLNNPDLAVRIMDNDQKILHDKNSVGFEEKVTTKNGESFHFLSKKSPLKDKEGNTVGIVGVSVDITKRKELQQKVEKLTNQLQSKDTN